MASSTKSWTLRVRRIPLDTSRQSLEEQLRSIDESSSPLGVALKSIKVCSLAPRNKNTSNATVVVKTTASLDQLLEDFRTAAADSDLPYDLDNSFDGVTPLTESKNDVACDIIAVSGLNSHAFGSWKAPKKNDQWLRDWLPQDVPNARILLYGYDTRLQESHSLSSIEDLGRICLDRLTAFRKGTGTETRPIIFLGFSLGGLVVKEALVHSFRSPENSPSKLLHGVCCGLVFFGAPHWGIRMNSLQTIVKGKPNEELIATILVNQYGQPSAYLRNLSRTFAACFHGETRVVSIYEKHESKTLIEMPDGSLQMKGDSQLLVDENSATKVGVVGILKEQIIPFETDHTGLTKFESMEDPNYEIARDRISSLVEAASERTAEEPGPQAVQPGYRQPLQITQTQGGSTFQGNTFSGGGNIQLGNQMNNNFWH